VLFTTLNSSGHPSLETSTFSVTIIDEAAQSLEPSTLIPLRLGCTSCVLVGDHYQLSSVIFSQNAKNYGYDRSLFERCLLLSEENPSRDAQTRIVMLDTQYRMLPEISAFPSRMFYQDRLLNGANVCRSSSRPTYLSGSSGNILRPFIFFDLESSKDQMGRDSHSQPSSTQSRSNLEEAKVCVSIVKLLLSQSTYHAEKVGPIGVITPYQDQLSVLRREFSASGLLPVLQNIDSRAETGNTVYSASREFDSGKYLAGFPDIELNTVDAFQGREKNFIIFSCVRAGEDGIGFLSDIRRMNVAITRARLGLFITGKSETLDGNPFWNELITHAFTTNSYVSIRDSSQNLESVLTSKYINEVVVNQPDELEEGELGEVEDEKCEMQTKEQPLGVRDDGTRVVV
jgi:senataxin